MKLILHVLESLDFHLQLLNRNCIEAKLLRFLTFKVQSHLVSLFRQEMVPLSELDDLGPEVFTLLF